VYEQAQTPLKLFKLSYTVSVVTKSIRCLWSFLLVDKNLLNFLLILEFTVTLLDTAMSFFPVLGTLLVAFSRHEYSLESVNTLAHPCVKALFDSVQMIVHEVTEAHKERQRLLKIFVFKMQIRGQLEGDDAIAVVTQIELGECFS